MQRVGVYVPESLFDRYRSVKNAKETGSIMGSKDMHGDLDKRWIYIK